MALTDYVLPTVTREFGTYKLTLQVEDATITGTSSQTILELGSIRESVDAIPGVVEVSNLEVSFVEEYGTYSRGWWATVIEYLNSGPYTDDIRLKVELNEGAGYSLIFWGVIDRASTRYEEKYVSDGKGGTTAYTTKRIVRISFISLLTLARYQLMGPFITAVQTRDAVYFYNDDATSSGVGGVSDAFLPLQGVIASIAALTFGQSYDITDCVFINNNIKYKSIIGSTYYDMDSLYVLTGSLGYYLSSSAKYIGNTFGNLFDYLAAICDSFGVIARHSYNGSRHTIEISSRGQTFATYLTFDNAPVESGFTLASENATDGIHYLYENLSGTRFETWQKNGDFFTTEPKAEYVRFDLDINTLYTGGTTHNTADSFARPFLLSGGNLYVLNSLQYFDAATGSLTVSLSMTDAIVRYLSSLFGGTRTMQRKYWTLKANNGSTTEYSNLEVLRRIQDDDGVGDKTYYAKSTEKNLDEGSTAVVWMED